LAARWDDEEIIKRKKRGILVISFIIISFIIMLVLATILGEINTGKMKPPF
jgi:type IV secretory pathway component VirB8